VSEKLLSKTVLDKETGCLIWQGARNQLGYAVVERSGRNKYVHRIVVNAPTGSVVRHKCDNPTCVNPEHLTIGSQAENIADAVDRNRIARGNKLPHAKLNPELVREIRAKYESGKFSQHVLAQEYGVTQMAISHLVRRNTWRHV